MQQQNLYLGIDVGTSGVRTAVIDDSGTVISSASTAMEAPIQIDHRPCQDANIWWQATRDCLLKQSQQLQMTGWHMCDIAAISVDATSGTLLLVDADLNPLTPGYMYNSGNFFAEAEQIARIAPENSIAQGPGSGLARLLFLQKQGLIGSAAHAMHQADWIAAKLMSVGGFSDETNVLKMGFDVVQRRWPDWFSSCGVRSALLPDVNH
jgi:D-ribulokinase